MSEQDDVPCGTLKDTIPFTAVVLADALPMRLLLSTIDVEPHCRRM